MSPAEAEDIDSLGNLEERINRAVELVASLRSERDAMAGKLEAAAAERDAMRKELNQATLLAQKATQELDELKLERKQVRTRIEKLLGQMDLLSAT
ncbi:MAG: cell division protein ZapB [Limisphaerales bacterium]